MIFVLHQSERYEYTSLGLNVKGVRLDTEPVTRWTWSYRQGSEKNPGTETFAVSPHSYGSEREARSAIAKARKAFGGARMAKVIPSDD